MSARAGIYLDWNATTPPHPEVLAAMNEAARSAWANPSSVHAFGRRAGAELERARRAVARLAGEGFDPRDLILTSSGTEANNLALMHAFARPGGALVTSRLEHPSVVRSAEALEARGVVVVWIEPEPSGLLEPQAVSEAIERAAREAEVRLVAITAVNHETGVIQPVPAIAAITRGKGICLHVDAVQAVGRIEPARWAGADLLSLAAHKIRGPKGIGALATARGVRILPLMFGGAQERGLRPGTQDPIASAGFATAAERALTGPERYAPLAALRDRFEERLLELGASAGVLPLRNGEAERVPHVTNLSWPGHRGDELAAALDLEGVAVSSGSACSAGTAEPSPVIRAMLGESRARSAVRVSLGEETSWAELDEALSRWARVLARRPR